MNRSQNQWFDHNYYSTYRIASKVERLAMSPDYHYLEALMLDDGILEFLPHWQRDSALHKFIRYVTDEILEADNAGDRVVLFGSDPMQPKRTIPIEAALVSYGLQDKISFEIPDVPLIAHTEGNVTRFEVATEVYDACYEHFLDLRWGQEYEDLLARISGEVFYLMFTNRVALQALHEYLSLYVRGLAYDVDELQDSGYMKCLKRAGVPRRAKMPKWVQRAVYFRDRGMCAKCGRDLTGLVNRFSSENFDHMIPLAQGGLNDVTNLQLLCSYCNNKKSDKFQLVSSRYQNWY
ncbi:HNH endonuclease signature motif containing protein [Streptomyces sp. SCSIO 75703]|uniref:HNH endonuclease n=1 Tax=unclassified Streptomyces TaxID=2593676 RepID=UPI0006B4DE93|nr:HNH endonuclease signature motif containing protein [Streptomyces sp. TP-A0875]